MHAWLQGKGPKRKMEAIIYALHRMTMPRMRAQHPNRMTLGMRVSLQCENKNVRTWACSPRIAPFLRTGALQSVDSARNRSCRSCVLHGALCI